MDSSRTILASRVLSTLLPAPQPPAPICAGLKASHQGAAGQLGSLVPLGQVWSMVLRYGREVGQERPERVTCAAPHRTPWRGLMPGEQERQGHPQPASPRDPAAGCLAPATWTSLPRSLSGSRLTLSACQLLPIGCHGDADAGCAVGWGLGGPAGGGGARGHTVAPLLLGLHLRERGVAVPQFYVWCLLARVDEGLPEATFWVLFYLWLPRLSRCPAPNKGPRNICSMNEQSNKQNVNSGAFLKHP